ncbi:hypothetical protein [Brucella sp. 2716]|uniref:hypothetical protein n=1 Tax=Brucella sp. 2716 TaxID=2975052 RepID=UPI00217E41E4|nr:hypothetical protein [Brucella sp. 2716]UWF59810.1 hypothetical protein NYO66_04675 [Brucella sp. 2716]
MAQQGRVQTRDYQNNLKLQPQAKPVDTYEAPAAIPQDRNAAQLISALSSFSTSLGGLAPHVAAASAEQDTARRWQLEKRIAGRTRDEWVADLKAGRVMEHAEGEWGEKAVKQASGMNYGAYRADELKALMTTGGFDWDSQDPDQYISGVIASDLDRYGSDRNFGEPYIREMNKVRGWAVQFRENRNAQKFNEEKDDAAFQRLDIRIRDWINEGDDPTTLANKVRASYNELGRDGVLGVDYARLDQHTVALARHIVDKNPEHALALMETTHIGRDGQKVRLADKPAYRDIYETLKGQAVKARDAISENEQRGTLVNQAATLFRDGRFDTVIDTDIKLPSGKYVTVKRDEIKSALDRRFEQESERFSKETRETPAMRASRELVAYRKNGLVHERIKAEVSGITDMITPGAIADPQQKERILQKIEMASILSRDQKATYMAYTSPKDRETVELYQIAKASLSHKDGRAYSDDEALSFAAEVGNPTSTEGRLNAERYGKQVEDEMKRAASAPGGFWNAYGLFGDWKFSPGNYSVVRQRGARIATALMGRGMEPKAAVKSAFEHIRNTSVVFNGDLLMDVGGFELPDDFETSGMSIISDFAAANPLTMKRNGIDIRDITLEPQNNPDQRTDGSFRLIDKNDRQPILTDKGNMVVITLGDIRNRSVKLKEDASRKAAAAAAEDTKRGREARERADKYAEDVRSGRRKGYLEDLGIPVPDIRGN